MKKVLIISPVKSGENGGGLNGMAKRLSLFLRKYYSIEIFNTRNEAGFGKYLNLLYFAKNISEKKYQFVYINSIYYLEFFVATILCVIFRVQFIIHAHGSLSKIVFFQRSFKKFFTRKILKFLTSKAKYVIFSGNSEYERSIIGEKSEVLFLRNYIEVVNCKSKIERNIKKFIYIGKIDWKYKGLDLMIDAFAIFNSKYKEYEFEIYGYGDVKSKEFFINLNDPAIIRLLNKLNACDSGLSYKGPVYGVEKFNIIKSSGALCLFSQTEAMPLILSESISCGTPILFTRNTNFQDIVGDSIYTCDFDVSSIVQCFENYRKYVQESHEVYSDLMKSFFNDKLNDEIANNEFKILLEKITKGKI